MSYVWKKVLCKTRHQGLENDHGFKINMHGVKNTSRPWKTLFKIKKQMCTGKVMRLK
jgi:hypothetical protein